MIPFALQDLYARSWSAAAAPFGLAPHAPFIGSFHPQIPQALISSYPAASPWLAGTLSPWTSSPWTGNSTGSINPFAAAALQAGFVSPYSGWQNLGLSSGFAGGLTDLSPFALARQSYLPGFHTAGFFAGAHPLLAGNPFGGGFGTPAFAS